MLLVVRSLESHFYSVLWYLWVLSEIRSSQVCYLGHRETPLKRCCDSKVGMIYQCVTFWIEWIYNSITFTGENLSNVTILYLRCTALWCPKVCDPVAKYHRPVWYESVKYQTGWRFFILNVLVNTRGNIKIYSCRMCWYLNITKLQMSSDKICQ